MLCGYCGKGYREKVACAFWAFVEGKNRHLCVRAGYGDDGRRMPVLHVFVHNSLMIDLG